MCSFQHLQTTKHKVFTLCDLFFPSTFFLSFFLLQFKGSWWFVLLHNEGFYKKNSFTMMVLGSFYKTNCVMVYMWGFPSPCFFFCCIFFFPSFFLLCLFFFHSFFFWFFSSLLVTCVSMVGLNILFHFSFTVVSKSFESKSVSRLLEFQALTMVFRFNTIGKLVLLFLYPFHAFCVFDVCWFGGFFYCCNLTLPMNLLNLEPISKS
jgi:hypothetical protein